MSKRTIKAVVASELEVDPLPIICVEEDCEATKYCEGWCHMHFLERFSISTKRAKSAYSF